MFKGGMDGLMKQAQEMQANMEKAKKELAATKIIGKSGGEMVKITVNGNHEVSRVEINPDLMNEDREMVEDLVAAAINDANRRVEKMTQDRMSSVTSKMGLPSGMKLPF